MGNVCRSLLYELLDVLSPDLAAVLPHARTSFFLGHDGEDRWVGLFPDGCRSHVRRMGLRSRHCLRKNSNPGSQDVYGRGTGGGWDLACCLRRQRASAPGSMSSVGGGVPGNQRWQVDRAAKLLRQSGWVDRACGDGFGRGQDGTVLLGFHHHCGHRLVGLAVLDIYCRHPSTGGLVSSPGLRRFALISKHAAKAIGSEQTLSAAGIEVAFIGRFVYISRLIGRCSEKSRRGNMNTFPVRCGFLRTMTSIAIHWLFLLIVTVTAFTVSALAQDIQKLDPALEQLVGPDSKLERIATGFNKWTEGPVWTHEGTLLFAEIPANNIDLMIPGTGASVFMHPSGYTGAEPFKGPEPGSNGMTLDPDGRVTVARHARRNVWRMESLDPKAQITILADSYQGKKFNSPNDLVYKSDGSLYFTDPPYGLPTQEDNDPQKELQVNGVYRIPGARHQKPGTEPARDQLQLVIKEIGRA